MRVTFHYDLSDAHRVGELVAALTAQGFNFEAEFFPVLPVPVQEEKVQEPELSAELVQEQDYWKVQQVTLDDVIRRALNYPPTVEEEDPDEWGPENL